MFKSHSFSKSSFLECLSEHIPREYAVFFPVYAVSEVFIFLQCWVTLFFFRRFYSASPPSYRCAGYTYSYLCPFINLMGHGKR
jgi:hypothetical protein